MHYAYIKFTIFFPIILLVFTWFAMRRALNWGKWLIKKNNLAHLALRIQTILVYGARNTYISVKLLRAGKRADHSHIVSHVKEEVTEEHEKVQCNNSIESGKPRRGGGGVYSGFQVTGMLEGFFWVRKFGFRVGKFLANTFLGSLI